MTGEDNADAHINRQMMGCAMIAAVTEGRLDFGTWEQVLPGDFNRRKRKRVLVKTGE